MWVSAASSRGSENRADGVVSTIVEAESCIEIGEVSEVDGLAALPSRSIHAACRTFPWRLEPSAWVLSTRCCGRRSSGETLGLQKSKSGRPPFNHSQMFEKRKLSGSVIGFVVPAKITASGELPLAKFSDARRRDRRISMR
jgi:hypothetical protein